MLCRRIRGSWQRWGSACVQRSWCPTWARWTLRRSMRSWRRVIRLLWKTTGESLRGLRHRPDQIVRYCRPRAHSLNIQVVCPVCTKPTSLQTFSCNQEEILLMWENHGFNSRVLPMCSNWCCSDRLPWKMPVCFPADVDTVEEENSASGGWDFRLVSHVQSHCEMKWYVIFHRW